MSMTDYELPGYNGSQIFSSNSAMTQPPKFKFSTSTIFPYRLRNKLLFIITTILLAVIVITGIFMVNSFHVMNLEIRDLLEKLKENQTYSHHIQTEANEELQEKISKLVEKQDTLWSTHQLEFSSDITGCDPTWIPFKHEKCIKILDKILSHGEAQSACQLEAPSSPLYQDTRIQNASLPAMLTIESAEEQKFLSKLIFAHSSILDNVWLGAIRRQQSSNDSISGADFVWSRRNKNFDYTHWKEGSPSTIKENGCVQMVAQGTRTRTGWVDNVDGFWTDAACLKRNLVVCQKPQTFSLSTLKSSYLDFRRETTKEIERLEKIAGDLPLGFIYVQFRDKFAPTSLWPHLNWTDVTETYAGEFFRAFGGDSASFGRIQQGNAPRLTKVNHTTGSSSTSSVNLPSNGTTPYLTVGYSQSYGTMNSISFTSTGGEVRPLNSAVRIWERA